MLYKLDVDVRGAGPLGGLLVIIAACAVDPAVVSSWSYNRPVDNCQALPYECSAMSFYFLNAYRAVVADQNES